MTSVMYDSVNLNGIPRVIPKGAVISPYWNGKYATHTMVEVERMFPGHPINPIDVLGTGAAACLTADVETQDISPDYCEKWISMYRADNPAFHRGVHPKIYCNRSTIDAVRKGTGKWVLGRDYLLWVATGDGTLYTGEGVAACQNHWYREYDSSVTFISNFA